MARNPDGQGRKPHKIKRGGWRAYLTVGYKPDGKPIRKYVYGRTQKACQEALDQLRRRHGRGAQYTDDLTLQAYLREWLDGMRGRVSARTLEEYERELGHFLPTLGRMKLSRLGVADVERAMNALPGAKVTIGKGKYAYESTLTARAANQARGVLKNALEDALRQGRIDMNPADLAKRLKHDKREFQVWTAAEIMAFLDVTLKGGATHRPLFYTALTTGLRAGELITLTWDDVEEGHLRVRRTITRSKGKYMIGKPKSKASNRLVSLSPDTAQVLEAHRAALAAGGMLGKLVFPSGRGTHLTHSGLRKNLHSWAKRAGVPLIRVHDLRHTYASMAISTGMTATDLARQLGHEDSSFTLRTYVHFFERAAPREAPGLSQLLGLPEPQGGAEGGASATESDVERLN